MPRFLDALNMEHNEIKNARIHVLDGAPANPVEGQIYYDLNTDTPYCYSGGGWLPMHGANYRGGYLPDAVYLRDDFVTYNGSTYIMNIPTGTAGVAPTVDANWDLLSEGGVSTYTNVTPMPQGLGGLAAGQTFSGMGLTEVLNRLLYPYQNPGFASFSMSSGFPGSTVEVGTSVSGSKTFTWSTSNSANVQAGSVVIKQGGTTIASGLNASGSTTVTIPTVTNNTPGSATWTITGTNTNGVTFSTSFTVTWQAKKFYGTSTALTLDGAGVQALANGVFGASASGSYVFAAGNFKYFAIPVSFTAPSSIKDAATLFPIDLVDTTGTNANAAYSGSANGLPFATVSVTNGLGVTANYRVYRSRYELGAAMTFIVA